MYPRTKRGNTVNYRLARTRLLGHTSVFPRFESVTENRKFTMRFWKDVALRSLAIYSISFWDIRYYISLTNSSSSFKIYQPCQIEFDANKIDFCMWRR